MTSQPKTSIQIGCWNVNQLISKTRNKLNDPLFTTEIEGFDIIGLLETKLPNTITVDKFMVFPFYRPTSGKNNTISGGLAILIKQTIRKGVKFIDSPSPNFQWILLKKDFFGFKKDMYVCFMYDAPSRSSYTVKQPGDILDSVERDIACFSQKGDVVLFGDVNARTGLLDDHITDDEDYHLPLQDGYVFDTILPHRNSLDTHVCSRGRQLIDLCIASGIRLLNGRSFGDHLGKYTCYKYNGNSVVDYCMVQAEFIPQVLYFHVNDVIPTLSDHSLIAACFLADYTVNKEHTNLKPFPPSYKWTELSAQCFTDALATPNIAKQIGQYMDSNFNDQVNTAAAKFDEIIVNAAKLSLKKKKAGPPSRQTNKKWYDFELKELNKRLVNKGKLYATHPNDPIIRGNYYKFRKIYSKACKSKRRIFKETMVDKLNELNENDPKAYWDLLNKLKEDTGSASNADKISEEEWVEYLQKLNTPRAKFADRIKEFEQILEPKENQPTFSPMDYRLNENEIRKAIQSLKNKKAAGLDGVLNEMFKHSITQLSPCLLKLFNCIFSNSVYPQSWKTSYVIPIFKTGDPSDPGNYRGITITNVISKIFNIVLNNRLDTFLADNKIIHPSQIGFQKGARTSDHMFVLRAIIEQYTKNAQTKLFTCFVDFRKAFDSVIHQALFLKLADIGVRGPFYKILKDMYRNNRLCAKLGHQLTTEFPTSVGVKQGDPISPNLFKIFINDLPSIFNEKCDPVRLGCSSLNCLLYADDLILLSTSKQGLQTCLDKLQLFCDQWCLEVNTDKTRIIIFNKGGKLIDSSFTLGSKTLECVQSYKYLGIYFQASGIFTQAKNDLYKRGLKAHFKLLSIFGNIQPDVKTSLHLFDHTIKPILLYGCEVWATVNPTRACITRCNSDKIQKAFSDFEPEKLNLKFCKYTLGVHKMATNAAVLGELGRFPLHIDASSRVFKYLQRLEGMEPGSLLYEALSLSKDLHERGIPSWFSNVDFIVKELKLQHPPIHNTIKSKMEANFAQNWSSELKISTNTATGKLRVYGKFKTQFEQEKYLELVKNRGNRTSLTRLRISAHKLEIEAGRYLKKKEAERLCRLCDSKAVENEEHFLFDCAFQANLLAEFIAPVIQKFPAIEHLTSPQKLIWFMSCEDKDILISFARYIDCCFHNRTQFLHPPNRGDTENPNL
jgi:hypothetical protein